MMKKKLIAVLLLIFLAIGLFATSAFSADVPMMTKDELKAMLGKPDLVLVDVRLGRDFIFSDLKIKGAERPPDMSHPTPNTFKVIGPDKTIVFYCACPNEQTSVGIAQLWIRLEYTKVYVLQGGWEEWIKAGYPTEKK